MFTTPQIRSPRGRFPAVVINCTILAGTGSWLSAQQAPFDRVIHVSVNEPRDRFVTGLKQSDFKITENGADRPIRYFSDPGSSVSIAIVGVAASPDIVRLKRPEDELILTRSLNDALRELAAAKNPRKAVIVAASADAPGVPSDIEVLKADADNLSRAILAVQHSYALGFSSSDPGSIIEVTLRQIQGLPPLTLRKD